MRVKLEPQELYNFQGAFLGKSLCEKVKQSLITDSAVGPEFSMELFLHSGTEGPKAINRLIELVQRQHSNIKLIPCVRVPLLVLTTQTHGSGRVSRPPRIQSIATSTF